MRPDLHDHAFDTFAMQELAPTAALALLLACMHVAPMLGGLGVLGVLVLFPLLPWWGRASLLLPCLPVLAVLISGLTAGWHAYENSPHPTHRLPAMNLNRDTRVFMPHVGCMFGADALAVGFHDTKQLTVSLLAEALGPPPGAYLGPYPTMDEASAMLADAQRAELAAFIDGVDVDGRTVRLPADLVDNAGEFLLPFRLHAKLVDDTLVLGVPDFRVVLIDTSTNTPFAAYPQPWH